VSVNPSRTAADQRSHAVGGRDNVISGGVVDQIGGEYLVGPGDVTGLRVPTRAATRNAVAMAEHTISLAVLSVLIWVMRSSKVGVPRSA
jgi:hypothetical protein